MIYWNIIGSLSLYCRNSCLDIFICPSSCRLLSVKFVLVCLVPVSTWNWQLWLEPCSWSVLNKHWASSSFCFVFRDMLYRKRVCCNLLFREEKPKLGYSVVYPEGACDRVRSQFQITALPLILQMLGWLGSNGKCSTELSFLNRDWVCWSVQPDVTLCGDMSYTSQTLVVFCWGLYGSEDKYMDKHFNL